ncbi:MULTISPECIES: hypothetical protein [Rhodococcus]|uniref:hypothetical protein n=1 Tax=Rhodococcus TaxID=1827 RepID=UPI002286A709|nr:hypothetical protein [Rhodococcus sp. JS3073]WAM16038.1 hypothetical protein OYT95_05250 [Rhodococcus sp. JS3073]
MAVRSVGRADLHALHDQWNGRGVRHVDLERQMVQTVNRGDGGRGERMDSATGEGPSS